MNADQSDHLAYAEVLALFRPKILMSQSEKEVSAHVADFLSAADGLIDEVARQVIRDEVDYLWTTFPQKVKTTESYRELVQVLLAQAVDFEWYSEYPKYHSDQDVNSDQSLCSFRRGAEDFEVKFTFVQYYDQLYMRVPNSLRLRYRRLVNHPGCYTQGLRTTQCKKAMMGLINRISEEVSGKVSSRRPFRLMVNSMLRTEAYQNSLARLGYAAPRHSAHLAGYAADIEKLWYKKNDRSAFEAITGTLTSLFNDGTVNLIEEETHWHICLNPIHIPTYETISQKWMRKMG